MSARIVVLLILIGGCAHLHTNAHGEGAMRYAPSLPTVSPIAPLRVVQRRALGARSYVFRLSDGSVWQDLEGARSQLRLNALVRIVQPRFGTATFMVSSNERRRVKLLDCKAAAQQARESPCTVLREGALGF